MQKRPILRAARLAILVALLALIALPSQSAASQQPGRRFLSAISQGPQLKYYLQHPDAAPAQLQQGFERALRAASKVLAPAAPAITVAGVFNHDTVGLPQNEESVTVCRSQPKYVLGGTNDFRGILDPRFNFTGWHFSSNGGTSLSNEGLLPPAEGLASSGDPVDASDGDCNLFAADLNFNTFSFGAGDNGVGVYRTTPATLASCPGGSDPSCWPAAKMAALNKEDHFLDKPWMDVGVSGSAGEVVWVTYTDYTCPDPTCEPVHNAIRAVRCAADLSGCTKPILISEGQHSVQGSYVVVGPDGRTYVTWETPDTTFVDVPPGHMRIWLRVAPAGSTSFGPTRLVVREPLNFGFAARLHANDFRVAPLPKMTVKTVKKMGHPRIFVTWEGCLARPLDFICEEPQVKIRYSDDFGTSWSPVIEVSTRGDNYFPTIANDPTNDNVVVAYYTNRLDTLFHNQQNVEVDTVNGVTGRVKKRQFAKELSNETEADPLLGGSFIGDYFQVFAHRGIAYVHYNANYQHAQFFGVGFRVPQQDNYLTRLPE